MSAPFLSKVIFAEQVADKAGAVAPVENVTAEEGGFDPDDFPDWYRDRVDAEETDDTVSTAPNEEAIRPYFVELAAVQTIDQIAFDAVTVLAGDNGSGKSTLIEALAVAAGFNPEGGSRNLLFSTYDTHSTLADHLTLRWNSRPKWGWFLRAETFYGMASHIARDDDPFGGVAHIFPDLHNKSHGESFLSLAASRFTGKGLYIFDEPEAALSVQGQMALVSLMAASLAKGSQFIISTHSPLFMAFPGAAVFQVDANDGIAAVPFEDLVSTNLWQRFFADPTSFFDRLQRKD